jgi:hypothetical protein
VYAQVTAAQYRPKLAVLIDTLATPEETPIRDFIEQLNVLVRRG